MTFTTPLSLKLAALMAVLAMALVAAVPADAITRPRECGKVSAKGKRWRVTADQIPCTTAKKWAVAYIKTRAVPRYFKCHKAADPKTYRYCDTFRYSKPHTFFIFRPR
jgi:hypothetical protein